MMVTPHGIRRLYENVLNYEIEINGVSVRDIRAGVRSLAHVYAPPNSDFRSESSNCANFNDPACRCAYLHKNAPIHTHVVHDVVLQISRKVPNHFRNLLQDGGTFRICSLGGGPGSDAVGVLMALLFVFGPFRWSVAIVDCMGRWEDTVALMMYELTVRPLASAWSCINNCQWHYLECNLLGSMSDEVNESIATAFMITMVKFVSATTCKDTENMVDKIFRVVKPGALVLFIDNAAGGFSQIIERSGKRNGLVPIYGPKRHVEYEEEALKVERFGYTSCYKTRVTVILLQKLANRQNKRNINPKPPTTTNQNVAFPKPNNPVRPSAVSNASALSPHCLQKPGATATARTKPYVANSADQDVTFSNVDLYRTPLIDGGHSSPRGNSDLSFARTRPTAVVPPKIPTTYRSPSSSNSNRQLNPEPISTIRSYPPVEGEVRDDFEETCCSCCSIS